MIKTRTFAVDRTTASQLALRLALRQYGWIFIVLMALSAGAGALFGGLGGVLVVGVFWAVIVGLVILFFAIPFSRFSGDRSAALRLHYEFSPKQVLIRTEKSGKSAKVTWDKLTSASMIAGHYMLRDAEKGFYTIPRRAFETAEDRARFESMLRERGLLKGKNAAADEDDS